MKQGSCLLTLALAALLGVAWGPPAVAAPGIGYVYPAGGAQGTTFRVAVGGQSLRSVDDVRISGEGVRGSVIEHVRALDNQELRDVSVFLRDLVKRRWCANVMFSAANQEADGPALPDHPWLRDLDEKSPLELEQLWIKLFDPKKQPNAQIAEQVEVEVTIDPGAPPGDRELRLSAPDGLSNPMLFQVGTLREVREEDFAVPGATEAPVVESPVLLNGQIMPGEVDHYRVPARRGQRLVIRLHARRLIPYLADAVPGWFQATLALYDPDGEQVAFNDDHRFDPDPALLYQVPRDGLYRLEVRDAIYRGRDDFVYRIAIGELPFVTRVFPLGGQEGAAVTASLEGWNLAVETLTLDTRPGGDHIRHAVVGAAQGLRNEVPYAVDALPDLTEIEPNDGTSSAQEVAFPLVVNGRIERPGDVDVFGFEGQAGQSVVAEVYARRLNSPLDSVLRLMDEAGAVVALNDDHQDREFGLVTHPADSYLLAELPRDGAYRICVSDAQRQGGPAWAYRLRLRPAQPDFALRLVPSAINVPAGRSATVTVHVVRKDGFEGDVDLALRYAPEGFALSDAHIPADQESIEARLTAPRGMPRHVVQLQVEGQAQIGAVAVSRPAVPAEDMMQAFLWRFLVPRQEMLVAVTGSRPVPAVWRPLVAGVKLGDPTALRIPLGGTARVQVEAPQVLPDKHNTPLEQVRFRLSNSPRGITLREAAVGPAGVTLTFKADRNIAWVGDRANLLVAAFAGPAGESLGVLPAIAFEVVQP